MPRRTYTPEERNQAIDLYVTDGPTAVQTQLGIHKGTVTRWAKAAGVATVSPERTAARIVAASQKWEERRIQLAHTLGEIADLAAARAQRELEADMPARDIQSLLTSAAICVDKAQLLSGEASMRVEHRHLDAMDAELEAMSAQLEARADE